MTQLTNSEIEIMALAVEHKVVPLASTDLEDYISRIIGIWTWPLEVIRGG